MDSIKDKNNTINVLHIDDEETLLLITKRYIQQLDPSINIDPCTNQCEISTKIDSYDCILLDYKMPLLNGIELAQKIREKSDVPIILYTGQGSEEVASKAFEVGVDDYLRKEIEPSHYQVLARRIRSVVEKARSEKELEKERKRYQILFEMAPVAITIHDIKGNILSVNESFTTLTGIPKDELIGKSLSSLAYKTGISEKKFVGIKQKYMELVKEGKVDPFEYALRKRSGEIGYVRIYPSLLNLDDDNIGIQIIIIDISEKIQLVPSALLDTIVPADVTN